MKNSKRKFSQSIHDVPPHNHRDVRCKYENHPQFQSFNMNNQRVPYYNDRRPSVHYQHPPHNPRHNQSYRSNIRDVTRDIVSNKHYSRIYATNSGINHPKSTSITNQQHITKRIDNRLEAKKTKDALKNKRQRKNVG